MMRVGKKYSLLFVEDDMRTQTLYSRYLRHYFDTVYVAGDGREGLALFRQYQPDIIIADIDLPYLNGLEMIVEIRKISKKTKIIILTAFIDHDKLLQAVELNLIRYLKKPVTRKELLETLSKALSVLETEKNKNIILLKENFWWDKSTSILYKETDVIRLSQNETFLMSQLIYANGYILTFDSIQSNSLEEIFTIDSFKSTLKRLRKKLPEDTIVNLFGVGYLLKIR